MDGRTSVVPRGPPVLPGGKVEEQHFGKIRVIPGENCSRFPSCSTLVIEDDIRTVIDPGCGEEAVRKILAGGPVDRVINSHYHFDHISGNYLFEESEIWLNESEALCFEGPVNVARLLGIAEIYGEEAAGEWARDIADSEITTANPTPHRDLRWLLSTRRLDETYKPGDVIQFGNTAAHVLSGPGHSLGNCFFLFPAERVVYTGDVDLTSFGPWYGGTDGDIEAFMAAAVALVDLEADYFITGHEEGVVTLEEFMSRIGDYLAVIEERDRVIIDRIEGGLSVEEMVADGLCYPQALQTDPWVYMWEKITVKKHVRRLITTGMIEVEMERASELLKATEPLPLESFGFVQIPPDIDTGGMDELLGGLDL
jgi:hydroxyacylglutathione hydrolase